MSAPKKQKDFEQSMRELDAIVEKMESGELPLDDMIAAYKQGAALVRQCRERLTAAKMEIKKLEQEELVPLDDDGDG